MITLFELSLFFLIVLVNTIFAYDSYPSNCPRIISTKEWGARAPMSVDYITKPVKYVIVHHTVTPQCRKQNDCIDIIKDIQDFHLETLDFHQIGYNFLVGGDGNIYEGAGWHKVGAHTYGYNTKSIGLAFIGNFSDLKPSDVQINTAKKFLECAIELGELDEHYKLLGARQVSATQSPGLRLYKEIKRWPNFSLIP